MRFCAEALLCGSVFDLFSLCFSVFFENSACALSFSCRIFQISRLDAMNCDGEMAISQITGMNRDVIQEICDKVRDFPPLYNVNHALYRDSNVKMQIWHLIAQEIGWDGRFLRIGPFSLQEMFPLRCYSSRFPFF